MAPLLLLAAIALPAIDMPSNCRAEQKTIPPSPGQGNIYASCISSEQAARERLLKRWATIPAGVRATCTEMGREVGSYVEMDVCVDIDTGSLTTFAPAPRPHRAH